MESVFNSLKSLSLSLANYVTPVLKESSFADTGYITPEEFVKAGDFLVYHCPTWKWTTAVDPKNRERYLPQDKQFLKIENVPCFKRADDLRTEAIRMSRKLDKNKLRKAYDKTSQSNSSTECSNLDKSLNKSPSTAIYEDNNWDILECTDVEDDIRLCPRLDIDDFDTLDELNLIGSKNNHALEKAQPNLSVHSKSLLQQKKPISMNVDMNVCKGDRLESTENNDIQEDEDIAVDMDEFEKSGKSLCVDDSVVQFNDITQTDHNLKSNPSYSDDVRVIKAERSYDLNITYDNFYRTPRFWFAGRDLRDNRPLTTKEMWEDVSAEHSNKTVTFERHPFIGSAVSMASVHPCRHAAVMKKLIEAAQSFSAPKKFYGTDISHTTDSMVSDLSNISSNSNKRSIPVEWYLIIFLKFVQTVVPTIQYDFTRNCPF